MEANTIRRICIIAVIMTILCSLCYHAGQRRAYIGIPGGEVILTDTLYVRDTIVRKEPVYEVREVVRLEKVVIRDTIREKDTLYMMLPREQIMWSDEYTRIYASGIHPEIDSVTHYINEKIVTRDVVRKARWGIGLTAGYGLSFGDDFRISPYLGVGLTYNILSW